MRDLMRMSPDERTEFHRARHERAMQFHSYLRGDGPVTMSDVLKSIEIGFKYDVLPSTGNTCHPSYPF